jgi:D-alanine transaminase
MTKWPSRAPSGRIAYVNGRYLAHADAGVHIEDRGLQFGDSIYEVWGVRGGRLLDETGHLDRLERSLKALELAAPMSREALRFVLREVMRRNRLSDGLLYLQVTRGAFRRDHPIPAEIAKPTVIVTAKTIAPSATAAKLRDGIKVITQPDLRWAWRDIKTTQLLPNLLAKTAAKRAGAGESWLIDGEGFVTEGGSANAWIVTADGDVVTHPLGRDILPGITRSVVMASAQEEGIAVQERKFTVAEVLSAREAFITGASGAAVPVLAIDGKPIGDGKPGALTLRLQSLYARKAGS